jgi:hypothetical protein
MVVPSWLGDTFLLQMRTRDEFFIWLKNKALSRIPAAQIVAFRRAGDNVLNLTPRPTDAAW